MKYSIWRAIAIQPPLGGWRGVFVCEWVCVCELGDGHN